MVGDLPARIPPLTPGEWSEDARGVFGAIGTIAVGRPSDRSRSQQNHVLRTFAQHPALAKPWLALNGYLLSPDLALPVRTRQIAIHRVAWIRRCPYMWSSHLRVSLPLGLTRDDFEAIKAGAGAPISSELDRAVIAAVDELVEESGVRDGTWEALSVHLDHQQLLELLFVVGCYTSLSMVFNAVRIEREPELLALAQDYGAPEPAVLDTSDPFTTGRSG